VDHTHFDAKGNEFSAAFLLGLRTLMLHVRFVDTVGDDVRSLIHSEQGGLETPYVVSYNGYIRHSDFGLLLAALSRRRSGSDFDIRTSGF
jgi:hypothetical protein